MGYAKLISVLMVLFVTQEVLGQQRLKPLMERVALLQIYIELGQQGYRTLKEGWSTVQDITRGEWDLHTVFFNSQQKVPSSVTHSSAVAKVRKDQQAILALYAKVIKAIQMPQFRSDEQMYFRKVVHRLIEQAATDLDLLNGLLINGHFSMSEAERLKRIYDLQVAVSDTRQRLFTLYTDLQAMANFRSSNEIDLLKKIYR